MEEELNIKKEDLSEEDKNENTTFNPDEIFIPDNSVKVKFYFLNVISDFR